MISKWRYLAFPLSIAAVWAIVYGWPAIRNETFVLLGSRYEAGAWYGVWSGFFGAIQPTLAGTAILLWYHHTCHAGPWCLRWGKYEAAGGVFRLCRHHHPDLKDHEGPRHDLIAKLHAEWKKPGTRAGVPRT